MGLTRLHINGRPFEEHICLQPSMTSCLPTDLSQSLLKGSYLSVDIYLCIWKCLYPLISISKRAHVRFFSVCLYVCPSIFMLVNNYYIYDYMSKLTLQGKKTSISTSRIQYFPYPLGHLPPGDKIGIKLILQNHLTPQYSTIMQLVMGYDDPKYPPKPYAVGYGDQRPSTR